MSYIQQTWFFAAFAFAGTIALAIGMAVITERLIDLQAKVDALTPLIREEMRITREQMAADTARLRALTPEPPR